MTKKKTRMSIAIKPTEFLTGELQESFLGSLLPLFVLMEKEVNG